MSEGDIRSTQTATEDDPFRFGWRYVQEEQPDGSFETKVIPLPEEALLHPEEGDQPVHTNGHSKDVRYLTSAIESLIDNRPGFRVFEDMRVDWQHPSIRPHGPDLVLFENVGEWDDFRGTFPVRDMNAKPLLVIEITSPDTKKNDLGIKLTHYAEVGVPFYYIVDRCFGVDQHDVRVLGYRLVNKQWSSVVINEENRLPIEPLDVYLTVEDLQAVVYDSQGERVREYTEERQARQDAEEQFEAEVSVRQAAERKARKAKREAQQAEKARDEAEQRANAAEQAQADLERQLRELQAKLQQPPDEASS